MTVLKRSTHFMLLLAGVLGVTGPVAAQATTTASATMLVNATVLSFCAVTALPLAFGNYAQTALAVATSVTVTCTSGTPYNVGLDVGIGTGGTVAARKMTFGLNLLSYGLFSDATHLVPWGPTIGTNTVVGTANGLAQILPVYGLVPASQTVGPGVYADTVTATVTY